MQNLNLIDRLAVCSWSLQPDSPLNLFQPLETIGLKRVQLALDPLHEKPAVWGSFPQQMRERGVTVASGMFGTVGEDYTTLDTIRETGGLVPDGTWTQNWENIQKVAQLAAGMDLKLVTFHAGFLPHEASDPGFEKIMSRLHRVADLFASVGIDLALETGQETADTLRYFLEQLERENVGVNFDPANMLLYDKGDPIEALRTLSPWLKQCHIKDARKTKVPGTWGEEVTVGTGEVDWVAFFKTLDEVGFKGDLCIEREAGTQRVADIRTAREFLEKTIR